MQGDFIKNCPIITPPENLTGDTIDATISEYDVIIMTQSCDLSHDKIELVLVCPYYSIDIWGEAKDFFKTDKGKEALRRGYLPAYHLLNKCDIPQFDMNYNIVDFRSVFAIPFKSLVSHTKKYKKRLRLLPPYREHLSQSFARFFMRVGLPSDIKPFCGFPY